LLAAVIIVGVAALVHAYWTDLQPQHIEALLSDNPWAPAIFVAAHIVASLAFFPPRLALAVLAGIIFGLWAGTVLAVLGAVLGAVACFALVRYLHRGVFALEGKRGLAWLDLVKKRLEDGGWRGVALVRLMPVPGTPANYAFGLTQISVADYVWGTFVGILPTTVFCVSAGTASAQALTGSFGFTDLLEPILIGIVAVAASFALPRLLRYLRKR
jgi:uncharacterized membrane protein YdjX (TVP38/TMEM64 family)